MLHSDGDRFCRRYRVYTYTLSQRRGFGFIYLQCLKMYTYTHTNTHTHTHNIKFKCPRKTVNFTPSSRDVLFIIFHMNNTPTRQCRVIYGYTLVKYNNDMSTSERQIDLLLL